MWRRASPNPPRGRGQEAEARTPAGPPDGSARTHDATHDQTTGIDVCASWRSRACAGCADVHARCRCPRPRRPAGLLRRRAGDCAHRRANGLKPEAIEALSWLARGALALKRWDPAEQRAETYDLAVVQLKTRALDVDPPADGSRRVDRSPRAGAGRSRCALGRWRSRARGSRYRSTSIAMRIQKNINLISLVGTTAPALNLSEFLGERPLSLSGLKGRVVLMFFWAHWCADCKVQGPVLAALQADWQNALALAERGLLATTAGAHAFFSMLASAATSTTSDGRTYPSLAGAAIPLAEAIPPRYRRGRRQERADQVVPVLDRRRRLRWLPDRHRQAHRSARGRPQRARVLPGITRTPQALISVPLRRRGPCPAPAASSPP